MLLKLVLQIFEHENYFKGFKIKTYKIFSGADICYQIVPGRNLYMDTREFIIVKTLINYYTKGREN